VNTANNIIEEIKTGIKSANRSWLAKSFQVMPAFKKYQNTTV
jgi:hypothetical protein